MPFTAKDLYFSNSEVWLKKKKKSINDRYWIVNRQAYQVTNDFRIEQSNAQRQGPFTPYTCTFMKWTLKLWEQETHTPNLRSCVMVNGGIWTMPDGMRLSLACINTNNYEVWTTIFYSFIVLCFAYTFLSVYNTHRCCAMTTCKLWDSRLARPTTCELNCGFHFILCCKSHYQTKTFYYPN